MIRSVIVALLLVACSPPGTIPTPSTLPTSGGPAPTATATVAATATPSDTPTDTPSPTAPASPIDGPGGIVIHTDETGSFLIAPNGSSLYTFDNDEPGISNCTGECIANWPAFSTEEQLTGGQGVAGTFDTLTRDDGSLQVTYNDAPLYLFAGDAAPGDTNGDGVGGVWHLAAP